MWAGGEVSRTKALPCASRISELSKSFYSITSLLFLSSSQQSTHYLPSLGKIIPSPGSAVGQAPVLYPEQLLKIKPTLSFTDGEEFRLSERSDFAGCAFISSFFTFLSCVFSVSSGKTGGLWYLLAWRLLPRKWEYCLRAGEQVPRYFTRLRPHSPYNLLFTWNNTYWRV